jgi:predicted aconitase/predicted aconitase with swiveling domain
VGTIVCAIRGGEASRITQEQAIERTKAGNHRLIYVYVVDLTTAGHLTASEAPMVQEELTWLGRVLLRMAQRRASQSGVQAEMYIGYGRVREAIETFLKEQKADLFLIGAPRAAVARDVFQDVVQFARSIEERTGVKTEVIRAREAQPMRQQKGIMNNQSVQLNEEQQAMLQGERGPAKQMAMRLLLDMAAAAGAAELIPIESAHLSGVSPLTGGLGLRRFLAHLASDPQAKVAVPTTLNAAGCDANQFVAMRITVPDFLEHSQEIVAHYVRLGVQPLQSCIPYEWDGVVTTGTAAWAESNAICFGNSYCGLLTNRESGLSALACALTGYTPRYGLLQPAARRPNLEVIVTAHLQDPTDFSILGDWIGRQRRPHWKQSYGPIPFVRGLSPDLNHEQRKALTAAAANYGSPMLYLEGVGEPPTETAFQDTLHFTQAELDKRYEELRPRQPISLIVLGCPQASVGELRAAAELLNGKQATAAPDDGSGKIPLWIFTSAANKAIAERTGLADIIRQSGALLLENTCPEVVPYDQTWVNYILTNSMKAEHYLKSGLNGIPTSVMTLADCVAAATGEIEIGDWGLEVEDKETSGQGGKMMKEKITLSSPHLVTLSSFQATGRGLPSQGDFIITGEAFVTDTPITFLGFVNRETGVIEEPGHPADGQSMAGKIAIFPRGIGSTVAPYVLLELFYRGNAPLAILNTDIDQQTAPACSLTGIPYAYGFDGDVTKEITGGATVTLKREGEMVTVQVV